MASTTLEQQIQAVKREVGYRSRVYKHLVGEGKMTEAKANFEIAAMRDVLLTLEGLHAEKHPTLALG